MPPLSTAKASRSRQPPVFYPLNLLAQGLGHGRFLLRTVIITDDDARSVGRHFLIAVANDSRFKGEAVVLNVDGARANRHCIRKGKRNAEAAVGGV